MTAYEESAAGLVYPRTSLPLLERGADLSIALLENRIRQLELQLDEQGWTQLDGSIGSEFTRDGLKKIVELARIYYLKNPLIQRGVEIAALYVWGQDLSKSAEDETVQAVVDRFWHDNRATLTGQQASRLLEVELEVTGNVFLALFPDKVTGQVRVRGVPMEEIAEIVCNPEDRAEVWYYRRKWKETPVDGGAATEKVALYPDWRHTPDDKPSSVSGSDGSSTEIRWESPLLHVKAGAFPHWRWGVPEVYAALDWARAYKEQLEDDATRSRALAKFAWRMTTQGGSGGVAAGKARLNTTLGSTSGETNPSAAAGSTVVADKSIGFDPLRIAGATLDPGHSRPARLMASAALGIPDHMFDADVGNHATAKTLDRPTELRFTERREMWLDVFGELLQWAIDADLAATRGLLPKTITEDRRAVDLAFPSLLERDIKESVGAVVDAATLSGRSLSGTIPRETVARLLMVVLGVDDVDGEIEKLEAEWIEQDERREEMAQRLAQNPPGSQPRADDPERDEEREAFVAALRDVREVLTGRRAATQ